VYCSCNYSTSLECLGHGVKIDGKKTVKKLLEGKPGGGGEKDVD